MQFLLLLTIPALCLAQPNFLRNFFHNEQRQGPEPTGTCEEQGRNTMDCIMTEMAPKIQEAKTTKDDVRAGVAQCFIDRGCEDPRPIMDAMKACVKGKLRDGLFQDFIGCAESNGATIPQEIRDHLEGHEENMEAVGPAAMASAMSMMMGKRKMKAKKMKIVRKAVEAICPANVDPEEMELCAGDAFDAATANKGRKSMMQMMAMGRKAMSCKNENMACGCTEEMMEKKEILCGCAQDILRDQEARAEIRAAVEDCKAEAGVTADIEEPPFEDIQGKVQQMCGRRLPFKMGC